MICQQSSEQKMNKSIQKASFLVATLKAISIIHQHNHWNAKGDAFYQHHLLFERLYNLANEDLDSVAEKFVGIFGRKFLNFKNQNTLLSTVLKRYDNFHDDDHINQSLSIEKDCILLIDELSKTLIEEKVITLGISDLLGSVASNRETAVYLLQQSLSGE